jgi:hypothetical protein
MFDRGSVRIHGNGEVEVELVATYLADLTYAYNSILVFETAFDSLRRLYPESGPLLFSSILFGRPRRGSRFFGSWQLTRDEITSLVPISERLVLAGVELHSPGAWDFIGKLNPLEVLRQYLNDRHERRKDRAYRESAEARRLKLENLKLENEVIAGRISVAKQMGATDRDLAPLLNELVFRPLGLLDHYQDKGVISSVEPPRRISGGPD